MLHQLRKSRRLVAPLSVAMAAIVLLGTIDWWHADDRDEAFQLTQISHDHAAHQPLLRSRGHAGTSDHCYLCHWLRTLGNGLGPGSLHKLAVTATRTLQPGTSCFVSELVAAHLPARAPPA